MKTTTSWFFALRLASIALASLDATKDKEQIDDYVRQSQTAQDCKKEQIDGEARKYQSVFHDYCHD
jgi:hypothetical protein